MEASKNANLIFLQTLADFLDEEGITGVFDKPVTPDPAFWTQAAGEAESESQRTLEAIAACLREDTTDFACIDRIIALQTVAHPFEQALRVSRPLPAFNERPTATRMHLERLAVDAPWHAAALPKRTHRRKI